MNEKKQLIPKKLWILWYQGLSEAPFVVRECIDSWVKENPTWDIVILDNDNLGDYYDPELPDDKLANLPLVKQSNFVRLQLLSKYGGVWADATTFCMKPLDDWIDDCTASGFFAFSNPGNDRVLSTWFLASVKECPLVMKWNERYVSFFMKNNFKMFGNFKNILLKCLYRIFSRRKETTRYWLSPVLTKWLGIYPYFIVHYLFERLVSSDIECQLIWENTKKISADIPHKIQMAGFFSTPSEDIKNEINRKRAPLYKLSWKYDHKRYSPSSTIYYLLEGSCNN